MSNKIKEEVNKIEIPKELHDRSKIGILKAKNEQQRSRKKFNVKSIVVAAGLIVSIGAFSLFNFLDEESSTPNHDTFVVNEDGGVEIPRIELPDDSTLANMIGLIVYNGKIYTQTSVEIDVEDAKLLVGEKLGTTKGTIDEWSKQEEYEKEFASTIGTIDVYSVKGYEKDFRIMVYEERDGNLYAEFYENLNGITVNSGEDLFGKLKMIRNVSNANYRTFSDWDYSIDHYQPITDMQMLNTFVENLNEARPLARTANYDPIGVSRNDEEFRELTIQLNDGSKVSLILLKDGYIYYGFMGVYFKMDEDVFSKMWNEIQ